MFNLLYSILFLAEIRNRDIQTDRMRFRRNLERIGEVLAYEISKTFAYSPVTVQTPIHSCEVILPSQEVSHCHSIACRITFSSGFSELF